MTEVACSLESVLVVLAAAGVETDCRGDLSVTVRGASQDSRTVTGGELFVAWKGHRFDAHEHLEEAARRGARAAIVERFMEVPIPQLRVPDARRAGAIAAHLLAGEPSRALRLAAVTGTNGKTTTVLLARHLLAGLGRAAAVGTLGVTGPEGSIQPGSAGLTTPGPVQMAHLLAELVRNGVTMVIMEASSHALEQRRLDGLRMDIAVFTNLTRDHLDYHGTFEAYLSAKARLLTLLNAEGVVVLNGNDPTWGRLPIGSARTVVTRVEGGDSGEVRVGAGRPTGQFGNAESGAVAVAGAPRELVAEEVALTGEGSRFRVRWGGEVAAVSLPLLGRFNVENALSAMAIALLMGMRLEDAAARISSSPPPLGRLEVTAREPVPVLLDYAHTPDALRRVLETLRPLYEGRLIAVVGAGGDRDREKRPEMGRIAVEGADLLIVTSDNPRTEDPEAIVDEIVAGIPHGLPSSRWERVTDRRKAIARALQVARPGDAILLAGKGHETYQIVGQETLPFDERQVVRELLAGAGAG